MDRRPELPPLEIRHRSERGRNKALHIGSAASIEAAVRRPERERIAGPRLPVDRHDVGVARERDAAFALWSDRRVERGFLPVVAGDPVRDDAMLQKIVFDEGDEAEIVFEARRVEGDETPPTTLPAYRSGLARGSSLSRPVQFMVQFMLRRVYGLSSENAGIATSNSCPASSVIW